MKKKLMFTPIAILIFTLGPIITAHTSTPTGIQYDPADKGYCEAYGIEFDATQVGATYTG